MNLKQFEILFYSLALAFCWVEFVMPGFKRWYFTRWGNVYRPSVDNLKPLDCTKCMTGWLALALSLFTGYGWLAVLMLFAGFFVGAIFEAIKMRYL